MIPRSNYLRLVALLLVVLAVTGCTAVAPDSRSLEPTAIAESGIELDRTLTVMPEPEPISTTPPEDVTTPEAATPTDEPDPTATSTPLPTPTPSPTQTPTTQPRVAVVANDYGEAPEINSEVWLNTDQPLRLEDLRGKVVLVDFWTYG